MDQGNNNQPNQSGFDYSGLVAPESMGGSNSVNPPAPANQPPQQAPVPATPPPTPAPSQNEKPLVFPAGGKTPPSAPPPLPPIQSSPPPSAPSRGSCGSWILIGLLTILLIAAILVFLSWKGWISLGGIEKLWSGATPTPTATISPTTSSAPQSNDATRKSDLAKIAAALKKYYADNGKYPISPVMIKTSDTISVLAQALVPAYITTLPIDPAPPAYYGYISPDGTTFELSAVLDDKSDVSGNLQGNYNIYKVTNVTAQ